MGIKRLASGQLHVAARSDMRGCKGAMVDWWFGFLENLEQYKWWHPGDHKGLRWDDKWKPGSYVGATCTVDESLAGGEEVHRLHLKFQAPSDIFPRHELEAAMRDGEASAFVCGTIGFGDNPSQDADGNLIGGRFIHAVYDTPSGCAMRNRFWLGAGVDALPAVIEEATPDQLGLNLMQHANTEYTILSRFLPNLYHGANYAGPSDLSIAW